MWDLYDIDKDGTISYIEFTVTTMITLYGTEREKVGLLFNLFDKDSDGSVSKKEFVRAYRKITGKSKETATKLWNSFPKKGKELSQKEFVRYGADSTFYRKIERELGIDFNY